MKQFKFKLFNSKQIKKGKLMETLDEETIKKLKKIFELFLTLNDSIYFNWYEGSQRHYQVVLSNIIRNEFISFMSEIDEEYIEAI